MTDGITPDLLLRAYACGLFPMARSHDDPTLHWIDPDLRGILPLETFHTPRSLARVRRRGHLTTTVDQDFVGVMQGCAAPTPDRPDTWINDEIIALFGALHQAGYAHSVETWCDGKLVGGLYGLALGGAFFGESMFSRRTDASKVALCALVDRLQAGGFILLDTQFITAHLARFGAVEIPRQAYLSRLKAALAVVADWQAIDRQQGERGTAG